MYFCATQLKGLHHDGGIARCIYEGLSHVEMLSAVGFPCGESVHLKIQERVCYIIAYTWKMHNNTNQSGLHARFNISPIPASSATLQ